jgi:GNAT superfamily N-acetyltransferase
MTMNTNVAPLPVRLRTHDRAALEAHFLALDSEDRRLRFGSPIGDEGVHAYVKRIDFADDGVYAIQDDSLRVVAAIHVARSGAAAELGLSVLPGHRGSHLGSALFSRAVMHLRNRGIATVYVHCLAENSTMMHIARKNHMRLTTGSGESDGHLELDPATPHSHVLEWLQDQRALAIQTVRQQARLSRAILGLPT